jgi:hypothetical protein
LVRLAIKPDVVGKRIELVRSEDQYSYLKPGDRGTVVEVSELPYEDMPFKVWVHWDGGSRLPILEGQDHYNVLNITKEQITNETRQSRSTK